MILEAESALLEAVKTRLINALGLEAGVIGIEDDEQAPATAGELYYAIIPNGSRPGRHEGNTDATTHNIFGVRVALFQRIGNIARDKRREVFQARLNSLNKKLSRASKVLRFDYATIGLANEDMAQENILGEFIKPLTTTSIDQKPRTVTAEAYDAKTHSVGDPVVSMVRGFNMGGAEFIGRLG